MEYRLVHDAAEERFRLRRLQPGAAYRITLGGKQWKPAAVEELARWFAITSDAEWRAAAIELPAQ